MIYGNLGNDSVLAGNSSDTIYGGQGNDILLGLGGNDLIFGGGGNDAIDAGTGVDVAAYDDARTNYIVSTSGGATTVVNTVTGAIDTLTNIEILQFAGVQQVV